MTVDADVVVDIGESGLSFAKGSTLFLFFNRGARSQQRPTSVFALGPAVVAAGGDVAGGRLGGG